MKTARRRAREYAVQGIYEWQLNADRPASLIEKHLRENDYFVKADEALFREILFGVLRDVTELSKRLQPYYDRDEQEVSPVERAIMLMAAFEPLLMAVWPTENMLRAMKPSLMALADSS